MKKLILIAVAVAMLFSCESEKDKIIGLKVGDIRTTETEHYIYIEKCAAFDNLGIPHWEYSKVISKDSIE